MVVVLSAVVALVLAVAAPQARGMAMYNSSPYYEGGAEVNFLCGFECGWIEEGLGYDEEVAYPDKGGSFELVADGCIMSSAHPDVEDHGFAELGGADLNASHDDVHWFMWGNGGNVIGGSPFNVLCTPEPPSRRQLSFVRQLKATTRITRQFAAWDTDGNGTLSVAEQRAGALRDFHRIDLNHDGVIDAPDVRLDLRRQADTRHKPAERAVFPFDLDGNRKVSPDEYWRYIQRTFVRPMSGGSGRVTLARAQKFYAGLP